MQSSALTSVHRAAGARLIETERGHELLTYGDVPAEYAAATGAAALLDETDRGRIRVGGAAREEFLHRLLANRVRALGAGHGNANLLLSPKGKVRFALDLEVEAEAVWLDLPPGTEEPLRAALDMYLFNEDVQLAACGADSAPLGIVGPEARAVLELVLGCRGLAELGDHDFRDASWEGTVVRITALDLEGSPGFRLGLSPAAAPELWSRLRDGGARPAGRVVRDILRCEAGQARFGVDVTDDVYPQEARLERAFSLDKGCYVGQEIVAKIDTYQGLNKRLVALRLADDTPVPAGTRLWRADAETGEWRDLGVVTSWTYSFALDTGLALAYVKRRHQKPGTVFRVGEGPGEAQVVRVPVRAGALAVTGGFEE